MYARLRLLVAAGLLLAVAGVTTFAQEQDEPQSPQRPSAEQQPGQERQPGQQDQQSARRGDPEANRTDQLWKQVGEIHSRIVAMEVAQAAASGRAGQTDRLRERPAGQTDRLSDPAAEGQRDEPNRQPQEGQRALQDQRDRGQQRGREAETSRTAQMWLQIGRLHKQIVALEAAQMTQQQSGIQRRGTTTEPGQTAQAVPQQLDRQPGEQPTSQPGVLPGQSPQLQQLWQQIARLQAQIVSMEVKDAATLTRAAAPRETQRQ